MTKVEQDWGDDGGLGPLLDAYAADRLRPDPERTAIVRARVVAEASRAAAAVPGRAPAPSARRFPAGIPRPFRGFALVGAGLLLVLALAGGALAASAPGGPLYAVRLWLETATLPSNPEARLDAELAQLDERLLEATTAARSGNGEAVTAALEAYREAADEAAAGAGVDEDLRARLAEALGRHVAVLQALEDLVPERAAVAIGVAIERAEVRIVEILATPPGKPVAPGKPAKPAVSPRATPASTPEATPHRTPPGKPETTPKPATPAPEATTKPGRTPDPGRTPPGQSEKSPKPTTP